MNTANPLANLKDIQMPTPISFWPLAPGWYFVIAILAILLIIFGIWLIKRWRKLKLHRKLTDELKQFVLIYQNSPAQSLAKIEVLLRRMAITRYPREQVAKLTGKAWLQFLDQTGKTTEFSQGIGACLSTGPYQKHCETDINALNQLIMQWMKRNV